MSSWVLGKVNAGYGDKEIEVNIEGGTGWGGNGYAPYRILIYSPDLEHILCLTVKDARDMANMLNTVADAMEE